MAAVDSRPLEQSDFHSALKFYPICSATFFGGVAQVCLHYQ